MCPICCDTHQTLKLKNSGKSLAFEYQNHISVSFLEDPSLLLHIQSLIPEAPLWDLCVSHFGEPSTGVGRCYPQNTTSRRCPLRKSFLGILQNVSPNRASLCTGRALTYPVLKKKVGFCKLIYQQLSLEDESLTFL